MIDCSSLSQPTLHADDLLSHIRPFYSKASGTRAKKVTSAASQVRKHLGFAAKALGSR